MYVVCSTSTRTLRVSEETPSIQQEFFCFRFVVMLTYHPGSDFRLVPTPTEDVITIKVAGWKPCGWCDLVLQDTQCEVQCVFERAIFFQKS